MTSRLDATVAAVTALRPGDDREAASRQEILDGLTTLEAPFDEHAAATHVTSSGLVVGRRGLVLHRHKRLGRWLQPGGHLDPGEWPHQAAARESAEETGLDVRYPTGGPLLLHLDCHDGGRGHRHLDLRYLLYGDDSDPRPGSGESQACQWFAPPAAVALADPGLQGALRRLQPYWGVEPV